MKLGLRMFAMMLPLAGELVERPAPGAAPTAFRIWAAGRNDSDEGPNFFTAESAAKLMAEQEARNRLYSSDFDHLSLKSDRPAEAGRASGWHRLEVRTDPAGNPELWAVDIQWCADVKAGLEEQPPRWRYFSPAFSCNVETGEVASYVNFAICINPLTHNLPSLASRAASKDPSMYTKAALMAALAAMMKSDATDDEKKESAKTLGEYLDGIPEEKKDDKPAEEKKADGEPPPCPPEKKAEEPPPPPADKKDDKEKTEAKAMAADLLAANRRIAALEIDQLLAARKDLPESVRRWCASQEVEVVRSFLKNAPTMPTTRAQAPTQGEGAGAPPGLVGQEKEDLEKAMGIHTRAAKTFERREDGSLVLNCARPSETRAAVAAAARKGQ